MGRVNEELQEMRAFQEEQLQAQVDKDLGGIEQGVRKSLGPL